MDKTMFSVIRKINSTRTPVNSAGEQNKCTKELDLGPSAVIFTVVVILLQKTRLDGRNN